LRRFGDGDVRLECERKTIRRRFRWGNRCRVRHDPGHHAVKLEDGGDFDEQRRPSDCTWVVRPWPGTYPRDFDEIGPSYEQSGVVLPMESTLEEVCTRAVYGSVDVGYPCLRVVVVYFDSLRTVC
jgi:hypothetical protein